MKTLWTLAALCSVGLMSCRATFQSPPLVDKKPDTISSPTKTVVSKETQTEAPKGTEVVTGDAVKTDAVLQKDTTVVLKTQDSTGIIPLEKSQKAVLPKGTPVVLPESTELRFANPTPVILGPGSEVTLPTGTQIAISKVNWYGVLFYCLLALGAIWYYIQIRKLPEDQDQDGFVDEGKVVGKRRLVPTRKRKPKR